jgi:hypothetical protein
MHNGTTHTFQSLQFTINNHYRCTASLLVHRVFGTVQSYYLSNKYSIITISNLKLVSSV